MQKSNQIDIHIKRGKADLPNIQGLILFRGAINESNYQEYEDRKKSYKSQKEE